MELTRLIAVHFGVAATMSLGFVVGPLTKTLFVAAAELALRYRRERSERRWREVRTLERLLVDRPDWQSYRALRGPSPPARYR